MHQSHPQLLLDWQEIYAELDIKVSDPRLGESYPLTYGGRRLMIAMISYMHLLRLAT
jgi:hypothetical protein